MPRDVGEVVKIVKRGHPREGKVGTIVTVYPNLLNRSTQQYRVEFLEGVNPSANTMKIIAKNMARIASQEDFYEMDIWDA